MAFQDITKVLYDGTIKLDYKDKAHRYYVRDRVDFTLPEDDPKAWSKIRYPKGTTTLMDETLEKKGLMTWPMGVALRELFGFYNFTNDEGNKMTGFSKEVGTLWDAGTGILLGADQETALPLIKSASEGYLRKQKKGADIGSVVHDAIEHYITGVEFDIGENYMWNIKEAVYDPETLRDQAMADFEEDVRQAELAFEQFKTWWIETAPELVGAEQLVYSKEYNVAGTYDGLLKIDGNLVLCDWKTSNASSSKAAAAPEGVYYSYFIQSAIYALAHQEMGGDPIDDLLIVSARKDGGFSTIFASHVGLSMEDCLNWAKAVITCFGFAAQTKAALLARAEPKAEEGKEDV